MTRKEIVIIEKSEKSKEYGIVVVVLATSQKSAARS
jgi:hypothetical protein